MPAPGGGFVRVVQRRGWDVELVAAEQTRNYPTRDAAMEFAFAQAPEWIEVGEVVAAGSEAPQHHRWTTLRRGPDGMYRTSQLNWGGPSAGDRSA
jgi:hypothetical protein